MKEKESVLLIRRLFLSLLPVQALAIGLPAINRLIDSFIVGNTLGTTALAAVGFVGPLVSIITTISSLLSSGSQLLCGQRLGKGDTEGIRRIFNTVLFWCVVSGLSICVLSEIFPEQIARLMGATGECLPLTREYIRGYAIGFVFMILSSCLIPFLQLDAAGMISTIAVVAMMVVSVTVNILNYYVLHLGLFGVGIATASGNIAAVLIAVIYFALKSKLFRFSFKYVHWNTIQEIAHLGLPAAIAPICNVFRERVLNAAVFALAGTVGMSAMSIAGNFNNAVGCFVEAGYSGSGRMIASVLVGQRDRESLKKLPRIMFVSSWYIYVIAYGIVFVFAKPFALAFGAEVQHLAVYAMVIRLFNLWYLSNPLKSTVLCIYQALGKVNLLSVFTVLNNAVFPILTCLLFKDIFGLPLVASIPAIAEIYLIIVYIIYYAMKAKKLPESLLQLSYIPDAGSVPEKQTLNTAIISVDDAIQASKEAIDFCKVNHISDKKAYFCGLCIEEMAVDTVRNRFKDGKKNAIDLRMILEDGVLSIMFRDNCMIFNPSEWLEHYSQEDPVRSIGIKMVSKLSQEMNYTTVLGLNILNIKLRDLGE